MEYMVLDCGICLPIVTVDWTPGLDPMFADVKVERKPKNANTDSPMLQWRLRNGLSQRGAGDLFGVTRQQVSHVECDGKKIPARWQEIMDKVDAK